MRRSQQLICLEKQTKKIDEISKYGTKCVNINIKGPLGHSDHELSENEQHISCPGFYPDKLMIWYVDQGTQL